MIYNVYNHCYNMQNICITIYCIYENKQKIIILRPIIHVKLNLPCTHVYYIDYIEHVEYIYIEETSTARKLYAAACIRGIIEISKKLHFNIFRKKGRYE